MKRIVALAFICALLWLIILSPTASSCKSGSSGGGEKSTPRLISNNQDYLDYQEEAEQEDVQDDDEEDESHEDIALDEEDFDLMCDTYVAPDRAQRLPDVIIIGAKKGGTRALIEFLKLHPTFKAAGPEIHFFDDNYDKGLEWYKSKMPLVTPQQFAVEKTPGYFHTPKVPSRIKAMNPDIKMLLIIRDPVKRLISDYNQFRTKNFNVGKPYPELEELVFTPNGDINLRYPPIQRSMYHTHMTRWNQHFTSDQLHVVDGDAFIKEPWTELQDVETFLNITPAIESRNFYFNATKGFYCARDIREKGVWSCTKDKCLSKAKGRKKPPVKPGTLDKLTEFFKPHNAKLYEMMNRTFIWPI